MTQIISHLTATPLVTCLTVVTITILVLVIVDCIWYYLRGRK